MKLAVCPRCLKCIDNTQGAVHTCTPTDFARKLEARVAELEAENRNLRADLNTLAKRGVEVSTIALSTYLSPAQIEVCEDFSILCDAYTVH